MRLSALSLALLSLAATAACRGDDDGDDSSGSDGGIDAPGGDMTIQQVQDDATPAGTPVALNGVVVVAIDNYGARKGNFYVMEPGGGERSGVLVFGAPLEQVADLAVGDLVDIAGAEKDEFSLTEDDATITELAPIAGGEMSVVKSGDGTVPDPHVVDSLTFGRMAKADREAEYEKWEGVLIQVNNVSVTSGLRDIGSTDPDFQGFGVTGLYEVDSSLAAIPQMPDHVTRGECLASVTGMGDYFFEYKVLPRTTDDIAKGGSGCPAEEADAVACADGMDNEADGFADCLDFSCQQLPSCQMGTTVVNIQNGTIPVATVVNLNDVIVTAVSFNRKNIWVADTAAGGQYNGVAVFRGNGANVTALPAEIVIGARVDVTGSVVEFNSGGGTGTLTQITSNPTVTFVPGVPAVPTAVTGVAVATLADDTTGEPYEGVLVELTNVRVTTAADSFGVRDMTAGAVMFVSDDDINQINDADATCYALLRGVWSYQVFEDRWAILPLGGALNTMTGGTCN